MSEPSEGETVGQRLYRIRLACGDGVRDPEPLDDFAKRVKRVTRRSYSAMTLSLLERMRQKWKLDDVEVLASVDPLHRTREWLAWGDDGERAAPSAFPRPAIVDVDKIEPAPRSVTGKARGRRAK